MNTPAEILQIWIGNGIKKANLPVFKMVLLGMAAGVYIGLGAHVFLLSTAAAETVFEAGIAKLVGAALFPVGLMLVVLCGGELFTGNNLLALALLDKKITPAQLLKSWVVVYLANFFGSVVLALLLAGSGLYGGAAGERAIAVATAKVSAPFLEMVIRGIWCNVLVVLAVWFQAGAKEMTGKIFAIWFPIMMFVFAGFEHSVANMTYIPLGMFLGAEVSLGQFLIGNLLPVTIGNLIGGAVIIPGWYYFSYK
ncbi:MAG: formate/nitrite transporter family protein [Lachnospiraceae bacterium]|nr:formate/nitrite transporter family protein [Lachnospiraceae bacterium]